MKSKVMTLTLAALLATTVIGTTTAFASTESTAAKQKVCTENKQVTNKIIVNGIRLDKPCRNNILLWFLFCQGQKPIIGEIPSNGSGDSTDAPSNGNDEVVPPVQDDSNTPDNGTVEIPSGNVSGSENNGNGSSNTGNGTEITPPVTGETDVPSQGGAEQQPVEDEKPVQQTPSMGESVADDKFMAEVEQEIFNIVNQERANAGLNTLSYNSVMEKYARIKSQDMGDNNYFAHEDLSGNLITAKMSQDGVTYRSWGENIAYIGGSSLDAKALAQKFMTNWMNSSGHRANILSTNFDSIGVGVYKIGNKVYATQEFYR